jgi:hypothetical protein
MPAKSKSQQQAFGIAAAVKEGKAKAKPGSPSAKIAGSMNLADIKDFASTPQAGLPKKVKKNSGRPMQPMQPAGPTPTPKAPAGPPAMPEMGGMMGPMPVNRMTGGVSKVRR